MSTRCNDTDRFDTWPTSLFINSTSVRPRWWVHVWLAREMWKRWNANLQSEGLFLYPLECKLGRRYNVVQCGVASLTLAVFTGWDGVMLVGDKHWVVGGSTCLANACFAKSHLIVSLFFFYWPGQEITLVWLYSECNWIATWTGALSPMLKVQTAYLLLFHWVVRYLEHVELSSERNQTYCF